MATLTPYLLFDGKCQQANGVLQILFFGTYGALNDKFGVRWMFQTDRNS
jgi:uncharacterized glyoxalase superfamily protein PhnB